MFKNIGQTLKTASSMIMCLGIVFSVVIGGAILAAGEAPGIGLIILVGGTLISVLSSLVCYGLGQLIQNTDILVKNTDRTSDQQGAQYTQYAVQKPDGVQKLMNVPTNLIKVGTCELCGKADVEILNCKITDKMGTQYRDLCTACMMECNATPSEK